MKKQLISSALVLGALTALPAMAQSTAGSSCKSYAQWQGEGKVTVVDFPPRQNSCRLNFSSG